MEQRLDYYSLVGFAPEPNPPEDLERLVIPAGETALFLDFDGTLVDIAVTPDAIRVSDRDRKLLQQLYSRHDGAVSVVSGRNLRDIDRYVGDFSGTVCGGHGAELRDASGRVQCIPCDQERLEHIKNAVMEFAIIDPRVLAEDKSFGIVLHYRQHPELESRVREFLGCLIEGAGEFELQFAKMAVEIKPKGFSKATAIERIMAFDEFDGRRVFFAGDDDTDETAFAWVKKNGGLSVKVGEGPTVAQYRTPNPASFKKWLRAQSGVRKNGF